MAGWNPWTELRRRNHIVFRLSPLPPATGGSIYWPRPPRAAIIIDPALSRRDRRAALAHELVHDERGGGVDLPGMPPTWAARVAIDERSVDRTVAERLVPADELRAFVDRRLNSDMTTTAADVAEDFDVPEGVALRALTRLRP